ncbi:MAG: hypothetical protein KME42_00340 [Tildeniella nuda ZEHNDER 1965/U140]|jgi:hypothetical protein|nr:hypothetical protein [Tildeniella nuda ZEHNDER 1965/U140]
MSETSKKVEILMRASSGIALGAALGSSLGLVIGSAVGSLILPGVGTLVGVAGGAFLSSLLTRNLTKNARSGEEKLTVVLDSIAENDDPLKEDILVVLEAKINYTEEDDIKESLIKMRISVNATNLPRPQKKEMADYIITALREIERRDTSSAKYSLGKVADLAQDYPNILNALRELGKYLSK